MLCYFASLCLNVCAVRRSVHLDTGITVITGARGTGKAREEKERGTDIENEDTEKGMNNIDPHAGNAQGQKFTMVQDRCFR